VLDYIPDDGYTEQAFIKAIAGIHGDFRFTYRPMLPDERADLFASAGTLTPDKHEHRVGRELASRIVSWSLVNARGQAVPVSEHTVMRLKPRLFARVYETISGVTPSDPDPKAPSEDKSNAAELEHQAKIENKHPGDARLEAAEKN
jgi:hypothetical protein